jgi:hypothetical protein
MKKYYKDITGPDAVITLATALKEEPDYRRVWEDTISMMIQDEYRRFDVLEDGRKSKPMADKVARNFVDLIIKDAIE